MALAAGAVEDVDDKTATAGHNAIREALDEVGAMLDRLSARISASLQVRCG
jgi:hypothetical protein